MGKLAGKAVGKPTGKYLRVDLWEYLQEHLQETYVKKTTGKTTVERLTWHVLQLIAMVVDDSELKRLSPTDRLTDWALTLTRLLHSI